MSDHLSYGAVVFDDDTRPNSGWASVGGAQAVRIRGTGDLASDVYWWCNLPTAVFIKYGTLANPKLKRADYLKPNMTQLHQELGLMTVRMPAARIAEITAEIFARVMRMAQKHYGLVKPVDLTLASDLYEVLVREDKMITPEIDEALRQSYQVWAKCENKTPQGSKMVTFRRPRIQHALDVLSTPIPGLQWEFIDEKKMVPEAKRVDWLISQSRPALVRASVKSVQYDVAKIVSFGGGAREERAWMSHPELLMLSRFANIKIDAVFLSNDYEPQEVYRPIFSGGSIGSLSVSNGILAENYWIALASSNTMKRFSKEKLTIFSPRAVWLSASDRFHTLLPALMMDGSGFCVRGYGRGMVTMAIQRGALMEARACAAAAGLNAPLYVHEDISIQSALAS
jgi:hypothetical protein